jgi:20S proteasome subunit alpha 7
MFVQAYTLYSSVRPFGSSVLLGAMDPSGPALYMIEPSGHCFGYRGAAVGKGKQVAKSEIEKLSLDELSCREAVKEAARILHVVHDEAKDKAFELELTWICEESNGRYEFVPKQLVSEAIAHAKHTLHPDEMQD